LWESAAEINLVVGICRQAALAVGICRLLIYKLPFSMGNNPFYEFSYGNLPLFDGENRISCGNLPLRVLVVEICRPFDG
jgi:hypothetical protein